MRHLLMDLGGIHTRIADAGSSPGLSHQGRRGLGGEPRSWPMMRSQRIFLFAS